MWCGGIGDRESCPDEGTFGLNFKGGVTDTQDQPVASVLRLFYLILTANTQSRYGPLAFTDEKLEPREVKLTLKKKVHSGQRSITEE